MDAALRLPDQRMQVLYVEDGGAHRVLMRALFRLRPHLELHMAQDGAQATAMARELRPALLMLDIHLPDCMGSELLPLLRLRFGWRDVPAVAVTAEPDFKAHRDCFIEVWRKPLDLPLVLQRLDCWLPAPAAADFAHVGASPPDQQRVTRQLH